MATDNLGNQTVLFDFINPGTSESFNQIFYKIIDPGVYNGMNLSVNLSGNIVEITSGIMCIISDVDKSNIITTKELVSWAPSGGWPSAPAATTIEVAVYWTFTWANEVVNWAGLNSTQLPASLPAGAVVLGTVVIDDTGSLVSSSTDNRTYGSNIENYLGALQSLNTVVKTTLVDSINEVNTIATFTRNLSYGRSINIPEQSLTYGLPFTSFRFNNVTVESNPVAIINDESTFLWVANYTANSVSRIDPFSGAVTNFNLLASSNPIDLTYDGTYIWVVNSNLNSISKINDSGSILQTVSVGSLPSAATYADGYIYVVNKNDHTVSKINSLTGAVESTISVEVASDTPFPSDIVYTGVSLYVACPSSTSSKFLKEINPTTEIVTEFGAAESLTEPLYEITFDGIYIWGTGGTNIIKWDTPNDVVVQSIANAGINKLFHNGQRLWFSKTNQIGAYRDKLEGAPVSEYTSTLTGAPYAMTDDGTHIWITMSGVGVTTVYRILK